jgi:hypothetical protein
MTKLSLCLRLSGAAAIALAASTPRVALAQDPPNAPLPPLPESETQAPQSATTKTDTPVVTAGVVRTNKVDTVVVAEPGSNVTVHGGPGSDKAHREYAPDPLRKATMIAAPIVLGVGGATAGIAFLTARNSTTCNYSNTPPYTTTCTHGDTAPPLVLYDVIVGAVPSAPRWAVGDVSGALIYTGLRGGSLLVASVIDWGNGSNDWIGPFTLGFLVPVTLAIVDLATAPHREDLQPAKPTAEETARAVRPRITGLTPVALTDSEHRVQGAVLDLTASF